jgi:hypothetical protein
MRRLAFALVPLVAAACSPGTSGALLSHTTDDQTENIDDGTGTTGGSSKDGGAGAAACVTAPPNHACGIVPQCGCKDGQTCDVQDGETGAAACVDAGTAKIGAACNDTSGCGAGLTCLYGACRPYCSQPRSPCNVPGTQYCVEVLNDQGVQVPNAAMCTIACDPRNPQPFCGTNTCLWFATYYAPAHVSDCGPAGTKVAGTACTSDSECVPGFACGKHPTKGRECEAWCRIGGTDCPAGTTCVDVYADAAPVVAGSKEGVCQ